jgi:hypothetical protein
MEMRDRRDLARVLLATCVHVLGVGAPEWGRAMLAELAQLEGRRTRWVFALGCVRSIAFRMPRSGAQRLVTAGALGAAVASVAIVAVALVQYPGLVSGSRTWFAIGVFVGLLLTYVAATANLGSQVVDSRLLLTAGVGGGAIAAAWMAVGLDASLDGPKALSVSLLGLGPLVGIAIGWLATARSGSSRVGIACVGLASLIAGYALFLLWAGETVATAGRPYDAGLIRDFRTSGTTDLATYAVSDSLGAAMMLLVLVPLVSLTSGLVGAAVVGTWRTPSRWQHLRGQQPR